MDGMFYNCRALEVLNLSSFNTSSLKETSNHYSEGWVGMFGGCSSLKTIYVGSGWKTYDPDNTTTPNQIIAGTEMFSGCTNLVGGAGTVYSAENVDSDYARIDNPDAGMPGYFTDINAFSNRIAYLHSEQFDAYYDDLLARFASEYPTEYAAMVADINEFMPSGSYEIRADGYPYKPSGEFLLNDVWQILKFHLEKVYTDITFPSPAGVYADRVKQSVATIIFVKLSEYTSPAHKPFNDELSLDDYGSGALQLSFDEGMSWVNPEGILYFIVNDLYFGTMIAPENMSGFFQGFTNLKEVHFNGLLDVSGVTDFSSMFAGCANLQTIYVDAGEDWSTINATDTDMFDGCTKLTGGSGTKYDSTQTGLAYARIDGGTEKPGYFTQK